MGDVSVFYRCPFFSFFVSLCLKRERKSCENGQRQYPTSQSRCTVFKCCSTFGKQKKKSCTQMMEWLCSHFSLTKKIDVNPLTGADCAASIHRLDLFKKNKNKTNRSETGRSSLTYLPCRRSCNAHHVFLTENSLVWVCKDCICHAQPWNQENLICTLLGGEWVEIILSVIDGYLVCWHIVMILSSEVQKSMFS